MKDVVAMRNFGKRIGVFALLFSVPFLPMMHLHPASEHDVHGETHQVLVHADFFPNAVHGPDDSEKNGGNIDTSIAFSHERLPEIDLLSPHIAQSFRFFSILKKQVIALTQDSPESFVSLNFWREAPKHQQAPPPQIRRFTPPSLRGPPSFV